MGEQAYYIRKLLNIVMGNRDTSFVVIDAAYEMIRLGWSFSRSTSFTKGDGENADVLIVVPDIDIEFHFIMAYSSSGPGTIYLYEGADGSGGSAIPLYNDNRNSSNISNIIATSTPSITTPGTELSSKQIGSNGIGQTSFGAISASRHEWILKRNTKYLIRFSSTAAGNVMVLTVNIFEYGH